MKTEHYTAEIAISKTPREIYNSILRISKWWTENASADPKKVGDIILLNFGKTNITFKVDELIPDKKISLAGYRLS